MPQQPLITPASAGEIRGIVGPLDDAVITSVLPRGPAPPRCWRPIPGSPQTTSSGPSSGATAVGASDRSTRFLPMRSNPPLPSGKGDPDLTTLAGGLPGGAVSGRKAIYDALDF